MRPLIDRVGRRAKESRKCESLINLMARHDLVDRVRLDHSEKEMWTLLDSSPSFHARSYLDRMLDRRADTDFVMCLTFHYVTQTDHRLVRDRLESIDQRD